MLRVLKLIVMSFGLSLGVLAAEDDRARARTLNSQGVEALKANKLEAAVTSLEEAVELDPQYAFAQYNFACALARMRTANKVCDVDAYKSRIMEHVEKSIALDPKRRERAKVDADLKPVHDTLAFHRVVLQRKLTSETDLRAILVSVTWYGPAPGAYGPMSGARFNADGSVVVWNMVLDDDDGAPKTKERRGTYELEGTKVIVHIPEGDANLMATRFGKLTWSGLVIDHVGTYSVDPSECSA